MVELAQQTPTRTAITKPIEGAIAAMVRSGWADERIVDFLAVNRRTFVSEGDVALVRSRVPTTTLLPETYMEEKLDGASPEVDVVLKMAQTIRVQEERLSAALLVEERIAATGGEVEYLVPGKPGVIRRATNPSDPNSNPSLNGPSRSSRSRRGGFSTTVSELIDSYWSMLTQYTRAAQSLGKLANHSRDDSPAQSESFSTLPSLRTLNLQVIHNSAPQSDRLSNNVPPPTADPVDVIDGSFTVQDLIHPSEDHTIPELPTPVLPGPGPRPDSSPTPEVGSPPPSPNKAEGGSEVGRGPVDDDDADDILDQLNEFLEG